MVMVYIKFEHFRAFLLRLFVRPFWSGMAIVYPRPMEAPLGWWWVTTSRHPGSSRASHLTMPYNALPCHITPYHSVILFAACFTLTVSSVFHITLLHWKNVIKHLMPSISEWRWCHCCAYLYIQGFGILRINVCFVYIDVQCVGSQQLLRPGRRHHVELSRHDRGKLHAASLQTADHFFFWAVTSEDKEG